MCIAIVNPAKAKALTDDRIRTCFRNNDDGMGLMYAHNGEIFVSKYLNDVDAFIKRYRDARKLGIDVILHFRIATHGAADLSNCHPFLLNQQGLGFCHNGMLSDYGSNITSDSRDFGELVLKRLDGAGEGWLYRDTMLNQLEEIIGPFNKIVLLDKAGHWAILNVHMGEWDKKSWYSNDTYKDRWAWAGYNGQQNYSTKWNSQTHKWEDDTINMESPTHNYSMGAQVGEDFYCVDCLPVPWTDARVDEITEEEAPWCVECQTMLYSWILHEDILSKVHGWRLAQEDETVGTSLVITPYHHHGGVATDVAGEYIMSEEYED